MSPLPFSAHLGWLFTELPYADRPAAAALAGFGGVEDPEAWRKPPEWWQDALKATGLQLVQTALPAGDRARGEKGLAGLPERRKAFRATVDEGLEFAERAGAKMVHVMAGIVPPEMRRDEHRDCLVESLALAQRRAAARGLTVVVEPMSHEAVPDYLVRTPEDALSVIEATGEPDIGVLLDLYHLAAEGLDPAREIERAGRRLRHLHASDRPGRHEPGTGEIDIRAVRDALDTIGYEGFIGCEYTPRAATLDGMHWRAAFNRETPL